ncbi:hypothetical protein ACFL58_02200 [Elusimicrobiota bacterium]
MKLLKFLPILILSLFLSTTHLFAEDFEDTALGRELIDLGLRFLDNPADLFVNLHSNNEDFSPVPSRRNGAVRFNFFPTGFPITWGNLNFKFKVLNDKGKNPQVDIVGMYGDILLLDSLDTDNQPTFSDISLGAVVSKRMNKKTRLYGGIKYSAVQMNVVLSTPSVSGDFEISELDFSISDYFIFTGISHEPIPDKFVTAQVGYGIKYSKIVSRLMVSHKHLDIGIDIFPEGLFVFHPFIAWHWYF